MQAILAVSRSVLIGIKMHVQFTIKYVVYIRGRLLIQHLKEQTLKFGGHKLDRHQTNREPGEVVAIHKDYFEIATGEGGTLAVFDLQPAGKKRMTAEEYLRGTGSKLQIGDRFE